MNAPTPAHLPKFQDWLTKRDGKAAGTAKIYARFLTRCAEHYGETIDERHVRSDADAGQIIRRVSEVVAKRDRWAPGTFNTYDVSRNLIFALQAYVRFAVANFPLLSGEHARAVVRPPKSPSVVPPATPATTPPSEYSTATDVPADELPERLRIEVSRLVRNTKIVQAVKAAHRQMCQVCGDQLELSPGRLYSEGHHLKPLGNPHNGPDVKDNILCVCPNCHAKLDFAAIKIDPKKLRIVPGYSVRQEFIDYHNRLKP